VGLLNSGTGQHLHFGIKLLSDKVTNIEHCQNIDASPRGIKKLLNDENFGVRALYASSNF